MLTGAKTWVNSIESSGSLKLPLDLGKVCSYAKGEIYDTGRDA